MWRETWQTLRNSRFALQESIRDSDGKETSRNTQQNAGEQDADALSLRSPNTSPIPPSVQQHSLGERRTNIGKVSYRRPNRDYSKSITWTYELNKDVYDIYIRVKSDGSGYMKRIKQMWDKIHPELDITAKNLRERALRIMNKKLIRETGPILEQQETIQELQQGENRASNTDAPEKNSETNTENIEEGHVSDTETSSLLPTEQNKETEKYRTLKEAYFTNFRKYKTYKLEERPYKTRIDRKIDEENLKLVNDIVAEQMEEMNGENGISLWDINVIHYTAAITVLQQAGKLKETKNVSQHTRKPGWQIQLEQRIEAIRRRIAYIDVILKCKKEDKYTKHQHIIEQRLRRWYRKTSMKNLECIRKELKHYLKTHSLCLKKRKTVEQRNRINREFALNPKNVHRKFKSDESIEIKTHPTEENIRSFWGCIWGTNKEYNTDADWIKLLEKEYCKGANQKEYRVTLSIVNEILKRSANNKAPGRDLIVMYWIKKLTACHSYINTIMESLLVGQTQMPRWLSLTKTILLAKNSDTHQAQNYRPIALQNNFYKVYTSILNHFLEDHCRENNIVSIEQAAGKKVHGGVQISYS